MFKKLAKSIREYKKVSIATPILEGLEVAMECIIPFIIANLVNEIKAGCTLGVIVRYGGLLVVMAALSLLFGALAGSTCATASCGLAKNLRKDLFYSIQNYSFENIDKFLASSLVTRMTTDVTNVQNAYMMLIRTAIRAPLMLVFAFVMAFLMGGRMAWIFLLVLPLLAVGLGLVIYKTMPLFKKVFKKYDRLNGSIQENVKAMRVVKAFVREDYEQKKFDAAAEEVCADFTRAERILALNGPMMQFCIYTVMVFVLSFGSYTIITSRGLDLDVGQFSALLTYSFMMLNSLMMVSMVFVTIVMAAESGKRIAEVLDEESTLVNPENPVKDLTLEQLSSIYAGKVRNWKELGGQDAPIVVISRDTSSGTFESWQELVMKKERVTPAALMQASNGTVVQAVAKNKNAIGYIGLGYRDKSVKGLTAAEASAKEGAVLIMCAQLADGTGGQGFYTSLRDCESPEDHFAQCAATPQNETIPDQWESQILARILMKHRVIYVSRPEMEQTLREMKLEYAPTLEAALTMAKADKGENASITVIPNGISVIVKEK